MRSVEYSQSSELGHVTQLAMQLRLISNQLAHVHTEDLQGHSQNVNNVIPIRRTVSLLQATKMMIEDRKKRDLEFTEGLLADPIWDIILDLFAAALEHKRISVTSSTLSSKVPATTGLRCLHRMEKCKLIKRDPDPFDRRRIYISLTPLAINRVKAYIVGILERWGFELFESDYALIY